jgi:hypothetical protein
VTVDHNPNTPKSSGNNHDHCNHQWPIGTLSGHFKILVGVRTPSKVPAGMRLVIPRVGQLWWSVNFLRKCTNKKVWKNTMYFSITVLLTAELSAATVRIPRAIQNFIWNSLILAHAKLTLNVAGPKGSTRLTWSPPKDTILSQFHPLPIHNNNLQTSHYCLFRCLSQDIELVMVCCEYRNIKMHAKYWL